MKLTKWSLFAAVLATGFLGAQAAHAELIYGLSDNGNNIFSFDSASPGTLGSAQFVTGLASNEQLLSIDVRPLTTTLYGVGSSGSLYSINPGTGAATRVGSAGALGLNGVNFGSDFNPVTDLLRITSDTGQNLRVNPTTGAVTTDTALSYGAGDTHAGGATNLVGIAYNNNIPTATVSTLYGIDSGFDTLVTAGSPGNGQLTTIGSLGVNFSSVAGLDISSSGSVYAVLQPTNSSISNLYTISTTTGLASLVGQIGGGFAVRDIAVVNGGGVPPTPEPATLGLLALIAPAILVRRGRRA